MARNKGTFPFAANFEVKAASPLDPRVLVEKKSELISKDTWPLDGDTLYIYKGLLVSVQEESAIYMLVDPDKILEADYSGWERKDGSQGGTVSYEDIYIIEGLYAVDIESYDEEELRFDSRSLSEAIEANKKIYIHYNSTSKGLIPCNAYEEDYYYYVSFIASSRLCGFDFTRDSQTLDVNSVWKKDLLEIGSGSSTIPDWSTSDESDPAYIKNRTHYKVEDISYGTDMGYGDSYYDDDNNPITPNRIRVRSEEWFVSNWINVYDGYGEYFEELYLYDERGDIQDTYSGDITVDMYTSGVELSMGTANYYVDLDYSTIKKLSEEFIPDTIARKSDLEGGSINEEIQNQLDEHTVYIEDLQNMKIDKENDDYYPNMSVGVADNLSGVDVVASEFTSRQSGGGAILDGTARIEAIKGNSIVWNQKLVAVNKITGGVDVHNCFSVDTNGSHSILTFISDVKQETSGNSSRADYMLGEIVIPEHKYLFCCDIKTLCDAIQVGIGNYNYERIPVTPGEFCRISAFRTVSSLDDYIYQNAILYYLANPFDIKAGQTIEIKNVAVYDLTKMFGAGNEPTTIEDFNKRIPIGVDQMLYNEGQMINLKPSGIKSYSADEEPIERFQDLSLIGTSFPDGMKSVGEFHDEIRYNKETQKWEKIVRIGAKVYQEGDADNAEYFTDGQITYYILEQPIPDEIDFDGNLDYQVWNGGTEEVVPYDEPTTPLKADIAYGFNAVGKIKELEEKLNNGGGEGGGSYDDTAIWEALNDKVDKVEGLGLSEENYTTEEKAKLAGLENYDDSGIKEELAKKIESEVVVDTEPTEDFEFGYDDTEIRQEIAELSAEVSGLSEGIALRNVGAEDTDESVDEPEIPAPTPSASNEWKCVFDGRMAEGDKRVTFETLADGTPLKAMEVVVQAVCDIKASAVINGYVAIKSTNNDTRTAYGTINYETTSTSESSPLLQQLYFKASPMFMLAELRIDAKCISGAPTYAHVQGGDRKKFEVYEDIVYIELSPNKVLTAAAPYIKIYAR